MELALQMLLPLHLMPSPPWVLTEFHPRHNNERSNLFAFALDIHMDKTTIKLQIAANGKTQARTDAAWEQNQEHSTGEVCWK